MHSQHVSSAYQPSQKPSDEATATHLTFIRDRLYFKILRPPNPVTTATTAAAAATTTTTTSNGSGTNATNILRVHLSFCSLLRHANHGGAEASRLSGVVRECAKQGLQLCNAHLEAHADVARSVFELFSFLHF